jgi:hypothetical protein
VRAKHGAAADIERRSHPAIDAQRGGTCGCANDVHDGIDRANLVKVDLLNGNGMNAGFGFAQQLKGPCGAVLYHVAQRRRPDDAKNVRERTMMGVLVTGRGRVIVRVSVGVSVRMGMFVFVVGMFVVSMNLVRRVPRFGGRTLAGENLDLSRSQTTAHYLAGFESGAYVECVRSVGKKTEGNTGIDHRAQQHVAADAGKTIQISNSHRG